MTNFTSNAYSYYNDFCGYGGLDHPPEVVGNLSRPSTNHSEITNEKVNMNNNKHRRKPSSPTQNHKLPDHFSYTPFFKGGCL